MEHRKFRQILSITVIFCFLFVSCALTAAIAKHAVHVGHDNTTHQQTWCGWLCAAGHALQTPSLDLDHTFTLITTTEWEIPPFLPLHHSLSLRPRAPPRPLF